MSDAIEARWLRSSYRCGAWYSRSSTVWSPRRASCIARAGPTPLTYWAGTSSGDRDVDRTWPAATATVRRDVAIRTSVLRWATPFLGHGRMLQSGGHFEEVS